MSGDYYYTNFTVPYGNTVTSTGRGLTVHATGACTIAGSILDTGLNNYNFGKGYLAGGAGGSGGGAAGASATYTECDDLGGVRCNIGGFAGSAGGGNGGNWSGLGGTVTPAMRLALEAGGIGGGAWIMGTTGQNGGSSGGAGLPGGGHIALICGSITGTDGTHTGTIDVSGAYGNPSAANSTGAAGGSGGGAIILSSQSAVSTWPNTYVAGGPGGLTTVPEAVAMSGTCTSPPKATLGVSSGALSGACTVVQAGAGCGTGAGIIWYVLGGGGTQGTAAINPTWSSGALASCTVTPGTSSGYTAAAYTTSGTGGDGGVGWVAEFQGW